MLMVAAQAIWHITHQNVWEVIGLLCIVLSNNCVTGVEDRKASKLNKAMVESLIRTGSQRISSIPLKVTSRSIKRKAIDKFETICVVCFFVFVGFMFCYIAGQTTGCIR
jgi:hypothetical protein